MNALHEEKLLDVLSDENATLVWFSTYHYKGQWGVSMRKYNYAEDKSTIFDFAPQKSFALARSRMMEFARYLYRNDYPLACIFVDGDGYNPRIRNGAR